MTYNYVSISGYLESPEKDKRWGLDYMCVHPFSSRFQVLSMP